MARLGQGLEQGWGKVLSKVGARLEQGLEQGLGKVLSKVGARS